MKLHEAKNNLFKFGREINEVEKALEETVRSDSRVKEASLHLLKAGKENPPHLCSTFW